MNIRGTSGTRARVRFAPNQHGVRIPCAALEDAVARCLAKQDGKHIGASEWANGTGAKYRDKAKHVLQTIDNYRNGAQSGGLP